MYKGVKDHEEYHQRIRSSLALTRSVVSADSSTALRPPLASSWNALTPRVQSNSASSVPPSASSNPALHHPQTLHAPPAQRRPGRGKRRLPFPGSTTPNALGTHASRYMRAVPTRLCSRYRFALPPPPRRGGRGAGAVSGVSYAAPSGRLIPRTGWRRRRARRRLAQWGPQRRSRGRR